MSVKRNVPAKAVLSLAGLAVFLSLAVGSLDSGGPSGGSPSGGSGAGGAPAAQAPAPAEQRQFHAMRKEVANAYNAAENDIGRSAAFAKGHEQTAEFFKKHNDTITSWTGTLAQLATSQGGDEAYCTIESRAGGFKVTYKTWNNSLSDAGVGSVIKKGTKVYGQLASLKTGAPVVFSAQVVRDDLGKIKESSMTEAGNTSDPEFIVRFTSIAPVRKKAEKKTAAARKKSADLRALRGALLTFQAPLNGGQGNPVPWEIHFGKDGLPAALDRVLYQEPRLAQEFKPVRTPTFRASDGLLELEALEAKPSTPYAQRVRLKGRVEFDGSGLPRTFRGSFNLRTEGPKGADGWSGASVAGTFLSRKEK